MTSYRFVLRRTAAVLGVSALVADAALLVVPPAAADPGAQTRYVATATASPPGADTIGESPNDCLDSAHPCLTIQYAVFAAQPGDTVAVGPGEFPENVEIERSVTLRGDSAGGTTITGETDNTHAVIRIYHDEGDDAPAVTISMITVANGGGAGIDDSGAAQLVIDNTTVTNNVGRGLEVESGTVTVTDSTISHNGGEGIYVMGSDGAVSLSVSASSITANEDTGVTAELGTVAITNSSVSGNGGEGIFLRPAVTSATVTGSTVSDNDGSGVMAGLPLSLRAPGHAFAVPRAGGDHAAAIALPECSTIAIAGSALSGNDDYGIDNWDAAVTITGSTVSTNGSGGIHDVSSCTNTMTLSTVDDNEGPGVDARGDNGLWDVTVSTIANNTGQGIFVGDRASATIYQSTIAGTKGWEGPSGGLVSRSYHVTVAATIVAEQADGVADCRLAAEGATIDDGGYNLSSDDSCGFAALNHSISGGNADLQPLADNSGPTRTMAITTASDALDKIPGPDIETSTTSTLPMAEPKGGDSFRAAKGAFAAAIPGDIGGVCLGGGTTDQRGVARPQNGKCDIGAYELVPQRGGGSTGTTSTTTTTPTTMASPTPTPTSSTVISTSTAPAVSVLGVSSVASAPVTTTVVGLASTGVGADRFAVTGILLLTFGVLLLLAAARRERTR